MKLHDYLVHAVTQCLELFNSPSSLLIRVVPGTNSPHTCRLVAGVALSTVVEVRVGTTRAVSESSGHLEISGTGNHNMLHIHTNISCHSYVRAPVRLAHNCDHGYLWITSVR